MEQIKSADMIAMVYGHSAQHKREIKRDKRRLRKQKIYNAMQIVLGVLIGLCIISMVYLVLICLAFI